MKTKLVCCLLLILVMLISACNPAPAQPIQIPEPSASAAPTVFEDPTPTQVPLQSVTLEKGDRYFRKDGTQSFIFSRNVAGYQRGHYETFIDWAKAGGSSFVRIQLDSWELGYTSEGKVDEQWAARWDTVFDIARSEGIYILPVFSGWFDWNAGEGYSTWGKNPLNEANGGPVKSPAELLEKDSATQSMWLEWMMALVERWKERDNILGWEIFSEVNLISGAEEPAGVDFINTAAELIRTADPGRPVTASLADIGTWPNFYDQTDIDFIEIHPYPPSALLDRAIIGEARSFIDKYGKPVLIGESGLNAESPEKYPENAETGVRHAVWAAIVSGAMNGRALYWEDSFGLFFEGAGIPWMQKYETMERPAALFVKGVDFSGLTPLKAKTSKGVWGAAIGSESSVIGWFRDAGYETPDYTMKPVLAKQSVTITVPGKAAKWKVDFYSTQDGVTLLGSADVYRKGKTIKIPLPDFSGDIAFKAFAK